MAFYASPRLYVQDASSIADKITRIETIIDLLLQTIESAALEDDVEEYRLDDGQTRINVKKRSAEQMMKSINAMQYLLNMYQNKYNGRTMRLLDHEATRLLNYC